MKAWLFCPSRQFNPQLAWFLGCLALLMTALFTTLGHLVTDGVLDLHFLALSPAADPATNRWLANIAQGVTNVIWLVAALWVAARIIRHPISIFHLLAFQTLTRWPLMIAAGYLALPGVGSRIFELTFELMHALPQSPDQVIASAQYLLPALELTAWSIPLLVSVGFMIWLMFESYRTLTGAELGKTVPSFIIALLVAEGLSKLTVW